MNNMTKHIIETTKDTSGVFVGDIEVLKEIGIKIDNNLERVEDNE